MVVISSLVSDDQNAIRELRLLEECLELRLHLLNTDGAVKSEFEKNEDSIVRIKTEIELNKLKKLITQKTFDLQENFRSHIIELEQEQNGM
jgi:hypothetical protein